MSIADILVLLGVLVAAGASVVITDCVYALQKMRRRKSAGLIIKQIGKVIGNEEKKR